MTLCFTMSEIGSSPVSISGEPDGTRLINRQLFEEL
jgi:hypothetical protein